MIKTIVNIFDKRNCVFHNTLDWLGKSLVNHQDKLWLSTGRVERLVLPVASVRGIKLLPTGSKCDRLIRPITSQDTFYWSNSDCTIYGQALFFFLLDLFMNCVYLEFLCSKQAPFFFNHINLCRRVILYFICYQRSVWEIMFFLFFLFCFLFYQVNEAAAKHWQTLSGFWG